MADESVRNASRQGPRDRSNDRKSRPRVVPVSSVPEGLTVTETIDWVARDKYRARAALAYEEKTTAPRGTLVAQLRRLADNEPPVGSVGNDPNANEATGETPDSPDK